MFRSGLIAIMCLASLSLLGAADFNWGIKYGLGSSTLHGVDRDYDLSYDFYLHDYSSGTSYDGRLTVRSQESKDGLAQNAGLYASTKLFRKTDSIGLRAELLWHRYVFNHHFNDAEINAGSIYLAETFPGTVSGRVQHTVDYLTLPVLISMNQELSEAQKEKSYQGAFVYLGPSFSYKLDQSRSSYGGIKGFQRLTAGDQATNFTDPYHTSEKLPNGIEELNSLKTDLVVGAGFTLKDILQFGLGKDEFVFDFRFTMGMGDLGDAGIRDAVNLRSIMFSIGSRL